jgi:hypothetical protein
MQSVLLDFNGDAAQVCDLAEAGDHLACKMVEEHQRSGYGLANLVTPVCAGYDHAAAD